MRGLPAKQEVVIADLRSGRRDRIKYKAKPPRALSGGFVQHHGAALGGSDAPPRRDPRAPPDGR